MDKKGTPSELRTVGNLSDATRSVDWSSDLGTPSGSSHSWAPSSCITSSWSEIDSDDGTEDGSSADDEVEREHDKENCPMAANDEGRRGQLRTAEQLAAAQKAVVAGHENAGTMRKKASMLKKWRAWCQRKGVNEIPDEVKVINYMLDEWIGPDRGTDRVGM